MKVKDIMLQNPPTLPHTTTYEEAASLLADRQLAGGIILDENGKLIGVITEKDLLAVLYPFAESYNKSPESYTDAEERERKILEIRRDPITKFAPKQFITTHPDTPILRIGAIMLSRGYHAVPVVDDSETLVGIIYRTDIYRRIAKKYLTE